MRKVLSYPAVFGLVAGLATVAAGCGQVASLKGRMAFKDANALYQRQDYKAAAEKYEETVTACAAGAERCTDPGLATAYFFLGNSYDNMFRSAKRGDPTNDAYLEKAIANYKIAAEVSDPQFKSLSMQYLVAAYGPDKLNDPAQSEPILQRMIEMDPKDTQNYVVLSRVYEDAGDYEKAEEQLLKGRDAKPSEPTVYASLAEFYERQGDFDKKIAALEGRTQQEPNNPEGYYAVAVAYWNKSYKDFKTPDAEKAKFAVAGIEAVDKALQLKPDYFEALTYKNLLLRAQALVEKNPARQQELIKQAEKFQSQAQEIQNKQRAGGE
jgi:tetratricopeptide (TPR) repeat protein